MIAVATTVPLVGLAPPASAGNASGTSAAHTAARPAAIRVVTLITGDRILIDAQGRMTGLRPAKGRENVPIRVYRSDDRTMAVPADAQAMMATGRLDQRLFDIAELARTNQKNGLGLIVGYRGGATALKSDVRHADGTQVRRSLKALNADALTVAGRDAPDLWRMVTRENHSGSRTLVSGIARVWLDGVVKASLDKSVPQIGVPTAWASGYDGKGVKVAVLDTGVDATHPDLAGKVIADKNFSSAADAKDRVGHGTHVASTVAGSGAKSDGKYKGVAPGAQLLAGKVLGDDGSGSDSSVMAGMEWAAEQGADIVNLSLGSGDSPGIDPMEALVNRLSAEKGILFAIAAGNSGPGTVGTPGTADAALTVGAVDGDDNLADFSSTGPSVGDGAVKPDVTAPGVDITAASAPGSRIAKEVGEDPPGYTTISGTSMATPHVAGAAAILKQEHPDWGYAELKGALTGSAKPGPYSVFEQGTGRIAVDRAIQQTVVADAPSVNFGTQQWPHTDDQPVTTSVIYRNLGAKDVTLDLTETATGPKGDPAPSGFFTLGARKVTVPAGGRVTVDLTADTRLGGTVDGRYVLNLVASGDGQSVRTNAVVEREVESYDLTLKYVGRDGEPASVNRASSVLAGMSGPAAGRPLYPLPDASGVAKLRVPRGSYVLDSVIYEDPKDLSKGGDWIVQPKLDVTRDTTATSDGRTARPTTVTVPDSDAVPASAGSFYEYRSGEVGYGTDFWAASFKGLRTAHLGPAIPSGLTQQWIGRWVKGAHAEYDTVSGGKVTQLANGYTRKFKTSEFATVKAGLGASAPGKTGSVMATGFLPEVGPGAATTTQPEPIPAERTLYLSASDKAQWTIEQLQYGDRGTQALHESLFTTFESKAYAAGRTYREMFNTGAVGPLVMEGFGVFRVGDSLMGNLPVFTDGWGHVGASSYSSVRTTLHRNGVKIAEAKDLLDGTGEFKVPSSDAQYKLATSVTRSKKIAAISTRIDLSWTFRSKTTASFTQLPLSMARFRPAVALDSTAPAGRTQSIPVTLQGAAAERGNLRSLAVHASYDQGRTWKKASVTGGKASVKNPAKGKGVTLRATVTDRKGTVSSVTVFNAYYGR